MSITLDQARGIVTGLFGDRRPGIKLPNTGQGDVLPAPPGGGGTSDGVPEGFNPDTFGKNPTSNLPPGWVVNPRTGELIPPDSPGEKTQPGIAPGTTFQVGDEYYQWNGKSITEASDKEIREYLNQTGRGGSDDAVSWANLGQRQREFEYEKGIDARDYARSILENDRDYQQSQVIANRNELGNRATAGFNLGDLFLNLASRDDALAKDPGNFPAYLSALQSAPGMGPALQNLVGQGVSINPAQGGVGQRNINDPRFQRVIDSLFQYGTVPNSGDVDRVQQAYNQDPEAARRWFEAASALDKGRGMATGGSFTTSGPMSFRDLSTGMTRVAGEAGPEQVTVQPLSNQATQDQLGVSRNNPRIGSAGTFGALAKAIRAGGYGSAFPPDVLARMEAGYAPNPGDVPDWLLQKLLPSQRELLGAGVLAQLGASGAADYDFTRGLFEAKGFGDTTREVVR